VPAYNSGFVLFAPSTFAVNLKLCARGKQTQSRKTLGKMQTGLWHSRIAFRTPAKP